MENYRPQLFLRTADITVALTFPPGTPDAAEKMVRFEQQIGSVTNIESIGHAG